MAVELTAVLDAMALAAVRVGVRRISPDDIELLATEERDLIPSMTAARQAEFASGRALLRHMLKTTQPILRGARGQPLVSGDAVASLAHDHSHAIAATALRIDAAAIGVDLEPANSVSLTDNETAMIVRIDDIVRGPLAAFVAKEAVYKAWSALGGQLLNHHDVRIVDRDVDIDEGAGDAFRASVLVEPVPVESHTSIPTTFRGRYIRTTTHWVALVVVKPG